MKVIVKIRFKDQYTKLWHEVDDELIVTEERYTEIKNFVKIKQDDAKKSKRKMSSKKDNDGSQK